MSRLLLLLPVIVGITYPVYQLFLKPPPPLPQLDPAEWWGPDGVTAKPDTSVRPFKVTFEASLIKDLRNRLKISRKFTPVLEGVSFEYGFNSGALDALLQYWAQEYDFEKRAAFLNQYPHFKTNVQGLDIHFLRVTPKVTSGTELVPVLLLHGWPGSVREFYEAIPLLSAVSDSRDFALELIIPSLPGYGFSDAAARPGLGVAQMAVIFRNLMQRLGFKQYYVQGGDWGSMIGSNMATLFPNEVLGYHTNMPFIMFPAATVIELIAAVYPPLIVDPKLQDRMYPLQERFSYLLLETGYLHMQATKPDTVGVALNDSPAGLLAYIAEKFSTWTDKNNRFKADGGLYQKWTKEKLIDNVMVYWVTNSITTSMRLYAESFNKKHTNLQLDSIPTPVPTWALQAKNEIAYQPPYLLKLKYPNLIGVSVLDDGGHFLAFELPEVFANDVIKAIGQFRKLPKSAKTEL